MNQQHPRFLFYRDKQPGTWSLFSRRQRQSGEPRWRLKGDSDDASLF
jgi:hypothetical protein